MEKYILKEDIKVFGIQVKNCPEGIGEAFDRLVNLVPGGFDRSYYGISQINPNGTITYKAAAEEKSAGEAEQYHCDRYTIEKGEYVMVRLSEWRKKTDTIKEIFQALCTDRRVDTAKPLIEWYKNNEEMFCMAQRAKE